MPKLSIGKAAPAFTLPDAEGKEHSLADYKGRWVLIYFYPKDDTPGCTKEACAFRDNFPKFKKLGITVLGISKDSAKSHAKFSEKFSLPFTLLSDVSGKMIAAYGAWGKKKFMGREYVGILRNSYLVNPEGKIAKVYEKVKSELHDDEVLADLKVLMEK